MRADEGSDIQGLAGTTSTGNGTDIVLSFGTVAAFVRTTIGTITYDEMVLLLGDTGVTCPMP
jgi:hypothetical protein